MLLVTSTLTVHVLGPAAAFTPVPPIAKVPVPAVAVMVGAPPQLLTTLGVAGRSTFAGSASLKVRLARAGDPAGFVIVNASVAACPTPIVVGANSLLSVGRPSRVTLFPYTPLFPSAVAPILAAVLLYGP